MSSSALAVPLSLSLLIQPRFEVTWTPGAQTEEGRVPLAGFRVRRTLVILQGSVWREELTYRVRFNVGTFGAAVDASGAALTVSRPTLDDARVAYRFADAVQLSVGQFKVPFASSFANVSVHDQAFAERMPVSDGVRLAHVNQPGFSWGRDVGATLGGSIDGGLFEYQVGVFDGDGPGVWPPKDTGPLIVARVGVAPLGGFRYRELDLDGSEPRLGIAVMASLNRHPVFDDEGDRQGTDDDLRLGSEFRFAARHLLVYAEADFARRDAGPDDEPVQRWGASVQASYVAGLVAPAIRYSHLDPDLEADGDGADVIEGAIGVYLPDAQGEPLGNLARLQAVWTTALPQEGPPVHQASVGAVIGF